MAAKNCNDEGRRSTLKYYQYTWGELIYGAKEELQALGIGKGMAFPGEPGGPKRYLRVCDPRGFDTEVKRHFDDIYFASISFPGRERTPEPRTTVAPGVRRRSYHWCDEYVGTAEALAAAGLVRKDQLPGQPGMRKHRVTVFPDGTMPTGAPTVKHRQAYMPGAKTIERASKTTYMVRIVVEEKEASRREEAEKRADQEYEERMRALPRPAPLAGSGSDPDLEKFNSVENYRRALQARVPMLIGLICHDLLGKLDGVKSTDGHVYGLTPESREQIQDAIDELRFALRDAQVYRRKFDNRTEEQKSAARQLSAKAEADPDFQQFLGRLNLDRLGGDSARPE